MTTPTFIPLTTTTLATATTEVNFAGLPSYTDYVVSIDGIYSAGGNRAYIRLNGDESTNYFSVTTGFRSSGRNNEYNNLNRCTLVTQDAGGGVYFNAQIDIIGANSTVNHKSILVRYGHLGEGNMSFCRYASLLTVGTITVGATANLASGTTISIYGVH